MGRTTYIVGNWKMNKTCAETVQVLAELKEAMPTLTEQVQVAVAPPFTALSAASSVGIPLASQNCGIAPSGAHTGEISAEMLLEVGVKYAIVGHSERRAIYAETDRLINQRLHHALEHGISPILCVGETLEQRDGGQAETVCVGQLKAGLEQVSGDNAPNILIAYEPVWAIGTGRTATAEVANQMHGALRRALGEIFSVSIAQTISILYGGSVKPTNSEELLAEEHIDGALVGGASLVADDFVGIIKSAL